MNVLRGLPLLKTVAIVGLLLQGVLLLRPDQSFLVRPLTEDSFYSLTVAAHLAAGDGLTIDGVHATNGVQPLICYLYAPIYWGVSGDRMAALRWVTLLQSLIFVGATFAVAWFFQSCMRNSDRRREVYWLAAALMAWSIPLLNQLLNGLETGLAVAFVFTSAAYYNSRIASAPHVASLRNYFVLGMLLGLGVLARIDIAMLVPVVLVHHLWKGGGLFRKRISGAFVVGGMSLLVSLPWWVYNVTTFGSLMPISGQAQQSIFQGRRWIVFRTMFDAVADAFVMTTHLPAPLSTQFPALGILILTAFVVLAALLTRNIPSLRRAVTNWGKYWDADRALPLVVFVILLALYYSAFFGAPHFMTRYLVSLRIVASLATLSLLYLLWHFSTRHLRLLLMGSIVAAMAITVVGFRMNFTGQSGNLVYMRCDWIRDSIPSTASVAMFQSGTVAYVHNRVVNLDGKVNPAALAALRQGRLPAYIDSMRFDYIIEWPELVEPCLKDPRLRGKYQSLGPISDRSVVYRRTDATSTLLSR